MSSVRIPKSLLDEAISHASSAMPHECCGLMAGHGDTVSRVYRLGNARPSPVSYEIDSTEQYRVMREVTTSGLELLAIYHSHPSSAPYPSGIDIDRAFFPGTREPNYPGAAYVIIGMGNAGPRVRAFRIAGDGISEIAIKVLAEKCPSDL